MIAKSIVHYWHFGTVVRYLQDAKENAQIHGDIYILANIDRFFERLDSLNLQVTKRASTDLLEFKNDLETTDKSSLLSFEQAVKLQSLMSDIRNTLQAELFGFEAYIVTPKRLDVNKLLSSVSELLPPETYPKLPGIAKVDISEAGLCIAFERPTAAAFHLLRGTESVLKEFYFSMIKHNRVDSLMWGPMVNHLREKPKCKQFTTLFNNLDNIRLSFRNPTAHPEKIYDIHEVQDLWGLCIDVINRMVTHIPNPKDKDVFAK